MVNAAIKRMELWKVANYKLFRAGCNNLPRFKVFINAARLDFHKCIVYNMYDLSSLLLVSVATVNSE